MPFLRGTLFTVLAYGLMVAMGVAGAPFVLWRTDWTRAWQKLYIALAFGLARGICGITVEIRGPVPEGTVIVAAKHQSLLDVLAIYRALPEPRFVMKRELLWMPVFGLYARRTGAVPIDRSGGRGTLKQLAGNFAGKTGQFVIYPQGTRVAPGVKAPYRKGGAVLYEALDLPMVLAVTNGGWFWPRRGVSKFPGLAVVEFLETVPPGLPVKEATRLIEARIETASERLSDEAKAARK